jgi:arylsulfatase A-like enzyme
LAIKEICSAKKNENLFIWLHYFDSHMPYYAPKEIISYYLKNKKEYFQKKHEKISDFLPKKDVQSGDINSKDELIYFMAAYFAALTYIDQEIGRLIKILKERGEYDDCMIVVTADHGENLDENGMLCGHNKLFDETTKVPLIIKFPGNLFKSQTYSYLVETADIYPTVLRQFDITPPEKIRGMNLVPYITGEIKTGKRFTIAEHSRNFQRSIRDDKWQLIEAIPAEEWVVSAKDEHNLKIADKLNLEGNVLLSRAEGSSKNYFFERPEVVSRLKKEVVSILERTK